MNGDVRLSPNLARVPNFVRTPTSDIIDPEGAGVPATSFEVIRNICEVGIPEGQASNSSSQSDYDNWVGPDRDGSNDLVIELRDDSGIRWDEPMDEEPEAENAGLIIRGDQGLEVMTPADEEYFMGDEPEVAPVPNVAALEVVSRGKILLWELDLCLVPEVWDLMRRNVQHRLFKHILTVRRITQRNRKIRFEVDTHGEQTDSILIELRKAQGRCGWFAERVAEGAQVVGRSLRRHNRRDVAAPLGNEQTLNLASWNINGVQKKRGDVTLFNVENGLDILALSETRRTANHWRLHMSGYKISEVTEVNGPGKRGLALAIRSNLTGFQVGRKSPYHIITRIYGKTVVCPFLVCALYLPHRHAEGHRKARTSVLADVRDARAKYPNDPVIMMGDWNRTTRQTKALLVDQDLRVCELTGSTRTYGAGARTCKNGDIDHIAASTRHVSWVTNAHVDTTQSVSDHFPILCNLNILRAPENVALAPPKFKWDFHGVKPLNEDGLIRNGRGYFDEYGVERDPPLDFLTSGERAWQTMNNSRSWEPVRDENWRRRWEGRYGVLGEDMVDEMCTDFVETCIEVADEAGIRKPVSTKTGLPTTKGHQRAAQKQRKLFVAWQQAKQSETRAQRQERWVAYCTQRKIVKQLFLGVTKSRWATSCITNYTKLVSAKDADPKTFWTETKQLAGCGKNSGNAATQPVFGDDGSLKTHPNEIDAEWTNHYRYLANEQAGGHSQDFLYWEGIRDQLGVAHVEELEGLNDDITVQEVCIVLDILKRHKASGLDGTPIGFYKLLGMWYDSEKNPMPSRAILGLTNVLQAIFTEAHIPESQVIALVVSIFKKGDPCERDNFRGISLMDSIMKILMTLLARRITNALHQSGRLVKEQAGFRPREEAVAQAAALVEILQRRNLQFRTTYALFLDMVKAYDVVPHGALFVKLDRIGVRGRILVFIIALYKQSKIAIRRSGGAAGEAFPLLRGLRQGCPLSPPLFDIFVNDIFNDPRCDHGARVHGPVVPYRRVARIPGLFFADDIAALAGSRRELKGIKDRAVEWAGLNEMTYGNKNGKSKCGLMAFRNSKIAYDPEWKPFEENPEWWIINGDAIPRVQEYTYLGVLINDQLDWKQMVQARKNGGWKALKEIRAYLGCAAIPVHVRVLVLRAMVEQTLLYGSEIWGLNRARTNPAQKVLDNGLRWIAGVKGSCKHFCMDVIREELRVPPVCSIVNSRRWRGYHKWRGLKTWIADLIQNPLRSGIGHCQTWVTGIEVWMNKYPVRAEEFGGVGKSWRGVGVPRWLREYRKPPTGMAVHPDGGPGLKGSIKLISDFVWSRENRCAIERSLRPNLGATGAPTSSATIQYFAADYLNISKLQVYVPGFGSGLQMVSAMRMNAFWSGRRLAKCSMVQPKYLNKACPCCRRAVGETIGHILTECERWKHLRQRFFGVSLLKELRKLRREVEAKATNRKIPRSEKARGLGVWLLGGKWRGKRLSNWLPNIDKLVLENQDKLNLRVEASLGDSINSDGGKPLWEHCIAFRIAAFLVKVGRLRAPIIKSKFGRKLSRLGTINGQGV